MFVHLHVIRKVLFYERHVYVYIAICDDCARAQLSSPIPAHRPCRDESITERVRWTSIVFGDKLSLFCSFFLFAHKQIHFCYLKIYIHNALHYMIQLLFYNYIDLGYIKLTWLLTKWTLLWQYCSVLFCFSLESEFYLSFPSVLHFPVLPQWFLKVC